ncbi:AAWKG family protein [Streptomyces sp. NPDC020571]|uniref:AAWKG family protein n=1 Tax=Streptomyces sp. NPDC020571 TaxID=3365079 RepID=UPI00378CFA68
MPDPSDRWAKAVEMFTGYPMPKRSGLFSDATGTEPEGNAPLLKVTIEDAAEFIEMTESNYDYHSGAKTGKNDFVINFYLPGKEDPEEVSLKGYSEEDLKERIYPRLRRVLINFVGPGGEGVSLSEMDPFSWYKYSDNSLAGAEHAMGQYIEGAGAALHNSGYENIVSHTNVGFSSNGASVDKTNAMDFSTFTRTAEAYDRVAKFFTEHAETLKQWKESLGKEKAAWKGKAAEVFVDLMDGLYKNYAGYGDQMHPKNFKAQHQSQWDWYEASSRQGDAVVGAGNAVFKANRELSQVHSEWMGGLASERETLSEGHGDPIEYWPGLGNPYGILYSMLQSVSDWVYNNNARFAVEASKTTTSSTHSQGNSSSSHSWSETSETTEFYVLRSEAKLSIPGLGKLDDVSTWAKLGTEAVESWNRGVKEYLEPAANQALSDVRNAFLDAQAVIDEVLEPEVTSYGSAGGSGGGGGVDKKVDKIKDDADKAIAKANAAAEKAIAEAEAAAAKANAEAKAAIAKANAEAKKAAEEAKAAAKESNDEAKVAIDEANKEAEKAVEDAKAAGKQSNAEAKVAIDEANKEAEKAAKESNAEAKTAIDEANKEAEKALDKTNREAKTAIDEANGQVDKMQDRTSLQIGDANNQGDHRADRTDAEAKTAIDSANDKVDKALQEAGNQARTAIGDPNGQVGADGGRLGGSGSSLPPVPGGGFVTSRQPGDPLGNKSRGITTPNLDGGFTTEFPDGSRQVVDSNGTITEIGPDGTKTVTRPDGSRTITDPDGNVRTSGPGGNLNGSREHITVDGPSGEIVTRPDGSTVVDGPSGEIVTRPDGSTVVDGPGGRTETSSDGPVKVTGPDGSIKVTSPDGSVTVNSPDGSSSVTRPDGSSRVELSDGTVRETGADGRITVKEPDGKVTVSYPDGSAKVTMPDGSVQEISRDGTVTEMSPDGRTVVEGSKVDVGNPGSGLGNPGDRIGNPGGNLGNPGDRIGIDNPGGLGNRSDVPRIEIDHPKGGLDQVIADRPNGSTGLSGGDLRDHGALVPGGPGDASGYDDDPYDDYGSENGNAANGQGTSVNPFTQGDGGNVGSGGLGGQGSQGGTPMMPPMGGMQGAGAGNDSNGERERSNPGSRINRPAPRRGSTAAQAASRRAAAQREQEMHEDVVVARPTASGGGMMPPPAQRSEATQSGDRERSHWTAEDEDVWGTDEGTTPAVIGR